MKPFFMLKIGNIHVYWTSVLEGVISTSVGMRELEIVFVFLSLGSFTEAGGLNECCGRHHTGLSKFPLLRGALIPERVQLRLFSRRFSLANERGAWLPKTRGQAPECDLCSSAPCRIRQGPGHFLTTSLLKLPPPDPACHTTVSWESFSH